MTRVGALITVLELESEEPIKAAGHERQLEIAVDFHGHGGGECIHVEEINAVGDSIFNEHALRIAGNQLGSGTRELVGQQERRLLMPEIGDDHLANEAGVAAERNSLIENAGATVFAGHAL